MKRFYVLLADVLFMLAAEFQKAADIELIKEQVDEERSRDLSEGSASFVSFVISALRFRLQ